MRSEWSTPPLVVGITCCLGLVLLMRRREELFTAADMYAGARLMPLPPLARSSRSVETFLNTRAWNVRNVLQPKNITISYVYADGSYAMRYTYLAKKFGQKAGGTIFANPDRLFPARRATMIFKVRFPQSFDFVKGGKLFGLSLATAPGGHASGGSWSPRGGSVRLTWRPSGSGAIIKGYVYHAVRQVSGKSPGESAYALQGPATRRVMDPGKKDEGNDMWYSRGTKIGVSKGTWHELALTVVLNTPKRADGVLEIKCTPENGAPTVATVNDFYFRDTADVLIQEVMLMSWFGGGDASYAPDKNVSVDFKDFKFFTQ